MKTEESLRRHFSRMGARVFVRGPGRRQREKIRIDVGRDRSGEYFDIRSEAEVVPEILDVQPSTRHLVLMVRDGDLKNKFSEVYTLRNGCGWVSTGSRAAVSFAVLANRSCAASHIRKPDRGPSGVRHLVRL